MTLVRNDTFGVLSIEPSGPYGLLDAVTPRSDLALWPTEMAIAQTYACGDIQAVGHACQVYEPQLEPPVVDLFDITPVAVVGDPVVMTMRFGLVAVDSCGETPIGIPIVTGITQAQLDNVDLIATFYHEVDPEATGYRIYTDMGEGFNTVFTEVFTEPVISVDLLSGDFPQEGGTPSTVNTTCGGAPVKRFDGLESLDGVHLTLQGGILCGAMSLSGEQGLAYARDLFEARESAGVEREFLAHILAANDGSVVDLTPTAGAVSARTGLALAEGYGISHYGGKPYIHTPATIGSALFARGAARLGDHAETKLGNPLVVGAGYDYPSIGPDGTVAAEGTYWIYVTGRPLIARGELVLHESFNPTNNDRVVLAERGYLLSVDCMVAAINVTLEG